MPESYPVKWAQPWSENAGQAITSAAAMFTAARDKERARRLAADQEAYDRKQTEMDRERQRMADQWQSQKFELEIGNLKQQQKQHKFDLATKEAQLQLAAKAGTPQPGFEATQGAEVEPGKAPMATPDTPAERAAFAASAPPEQVTIPADVTPSGAPINLPVQYREQVEAEAKKKQAEAIALYTAKQKAELANSESVAAAAARAGRPAAARAPKPYTDKRTQQTVYLSDEQAIDAAKEGWLDKPTAAAKPSSGAEKNALSFYQRAVPALEIADRFEKSAMGKGLMGQAQLQWAPNMLQTKEQQMYRQAQRAFTEARLRPESGAAIRDEEYAADSKTYFAQAGDTPEVLKNKRQGRALVLEGTRLKAGRAFAEYYGEEAPKAGNAATVTGGITDETKKSLDALFGSK